MVRAEQNVTCKGLDVACIWTTHGRGNIQRGENDGKTLFAGNWDAGLEYRYPFELNTAAWPPTYYGTFLNVSQLVEARAKLPWSFDPKTSVEIMELIARRAGERDIPVIVNIHNVDLARRFADRIVGMAKGEIVFDGPPRALQDEHLLQIYGGEGWLE